MKRSTAIYAWTVSTVGISAGIVCAFLFFSQLESGDGWNTAILALLLVLCRSLPLYVREDCAVDMSFISILTIFLIEGPIAAAALYLVTTPFIFVIESFPGRERTVYHIFNTPPIKTAFNAANLIISILAAGGCFTLLGGRAGDISLPRCIPPIIAYVVVSMLVNTMLMAVLLHFEAGASISGMIVIGFGQFAPNIICAAPLGYFLARLMSMEDGIFLVLLFMLPLLLARFSFKLYVDEKLQQYKVINALSAAIEAKDPYTVGHSKRVEEYSELIARKLKLPERRVETIKTAALFHDIGKIGIKDDILQKKGALDDDERRVINSHPEISVHILEDIDFYGDIKDIILCHHERYDGGGYPRGRAGEDIPLEAAIIAVADAFDAMTSDRPYRNGFSFEKAIGIVAEESGRQFNPTAAKAMLGVFSDGALDAFRPTPKPC